MIRPASPADIPALVEMGREFHREAGWPERVEFDAASFEETLWKFLRGEADGFLIVAEFDGEAVGMAAMLFFPFIFNAGVTGSQELFWYARPEHRNGAGEALLSAMESIAQARGARTFTMFAVPGLRDAALARLYRRRGYAPAEPSFIRNL